MLAFPLAVFGAGVGVATGTRFAGAGVRSFRFGGFGASFRFVAANVLDVPLAEVARLVVREPAARRADPSDFPFALAVARGVATLFVRVEALATAAPLAGTARFGACFGNDGDNCFDTGFDAGFGAGFADGFVPDGTRAPAFVTARLPRFGSAVPAAFPAAFAVDLAGALVGALAGALATGFVEAAGLDVRGEVEALLDAIGFVPPVAEPLAEPFAPTAFAVAVFVPAPTTTVRTCFAFVTASPPLLL